MMNQHLPVGRYRPYSLPKDSEIPKLRYVEIDDFDNPSCTTPSAIDKASFTTRFGEKSKAITSVRKRGNARAGLPVAGPSHMGAISISSSDSVTSVKDPGSSSGFKRLRSSTGAGGGACLQLQRLQNGQGLTFEQWMGVCMRCSKCDYYFLQGEFFEKHEKKCLSLLDLWAVAPSCSYQLLTKLLLLSYDHILANSLALCCLWEPIEMPVWSNSNIASHRMPPNIL